MTGEYRGSMDSSERLVPPPTPAQRDTAAAISVLRERAALSDAQEPQITESSTGVMINRARESVRRATY